MDTQLHADIVRYFVRKGLSEDVASYEADRWLKMPAIEEKRAEAPNDGRQRPRDAP